MRLKNFKFFFTCVVVFNFYLPHAGFTKEPEDFGRELACRLSGDNRYSSDPFIDLGRNRIGINHPDTNHSLGFDPFDRHGPWWHNFNHGHYNDDVYDLVFARTGSGYMITPRGGTPAPPQHILQEIMEQMELETGGIKVVPANWTPPKLSKRRPNRRGIVLNPLAGLGRPRLPSPGPGTVGVGAGLGAGIGLVQDDMSHGRDRVGAALAELRDRYPKQRCNPGDNANNRRINDLEQYVDNWGPSDWPYPSPSNLQDLKDRWQERSWYEAFGGFDGFFDWYHSKPLDEEYPAGGYRPVMPQTYNINDIQVIQVIKGNM